MPFHLLTLWMDYNLSSLLFWWVLHYQLLPPIKVLLWSFAALKLIKKHPTSIHNSHFGSFLSLEAYWHYSWCDKVCLLGVRGRQPARPLGHTRLQDCKRVQQCNHLHLQPPHALRNPHVIGPGERECSSLFLSNVWIFFYYQSQPSFSKNLSWNSLRNYKSLDMNKLIKNKVLRKKTLTYNNLWLSCF